MGLADRLPTHHLQVAQPIFTSAMCSASLTIINLLNDTQVNENGNAVYEMAYKVIWYCLVEDTSLFLRNLFERLTKENGKYILQILRRIIRFMPRLPAQAAFSLYNYLIGFIMYHVRTPTEGSQELIGTTLSVLWLVVPSVHGLFLKGLKQVLRKEQCDAHILITGEFLISIDWLDLSFQLPNRSTFIYLHPHSERSEHQAYHRTRSRIRRHTVAVQRTGGHTVQSDPQRKSRVLLDRREAGERVLSAG